jgi:membrane protein YdbS with pleckstrin-like domain
MSSPTTPTPASTSGNVAPAADEEVVFYVGSPKLRGELGLLAGCIVPGLLLVLLPFAIGWLSNWNASFWFYLVLIPLGILAMVLPPILVKRNKYRISNYRIDHEQGLLAKRIDSIELWHVEDVRFNQSLIDRMLGVGTIDIHSSDRTTPVLPLRSLPEPRKLFDAIKQRVIAVKRQRGVLKIDSAGGLEGHSHGGN